tara:strand:- start:314 stop:751 length:438 start_codon:yes stop_codon:yes gene_type:complete
VPADKFKYIVKAYQPANYELVESKKLTANYGFAHRVSQIVVEPITSRSALFTYLHECGHVAEKHLHSKDKRPAWQQEYEADMWAGREMKLLGYTIPLHRIAESKSVLRDAIEKSKRYHKRRCRDLKVLQYAYGPVLGRRKYDEWS